MTLSPGKNMKPLLMLIATACLLSSQAMAQDKKKKPTSANAEKCCADFGGMWDSSTSPGLCSKLGNSGGSRAMSYMKCAGRM